MKPEKVFEFAVKNPEMKMECFNSGVEQMRYKLDKKLNDKQVLIVYDLIDTGYTWYPEDFFEKDIVTGYEVEETDDLYIIGIEL
jgi:hypothetical protein